MFKPNKNTVAVFYKQLRSSIKQPLLLIMAGAFLLLGVAFAFFSDEHISSYMGMFLVLIIGMLLANSAMGQIVEDKTTMNLRFMSMAGVKPREYCAGTWVALMVSPVIINIVYGLVGRYGGINILYFLGFTMLASAVSVLLGITLGLSKVPWLTTPISMLLGLGPFFGTMNDNMERLFRFTYTLQIRRVMDYLAITVEEEIVEHICPYCGEIVLCLEEDVVNGAYEAASRGVMEEAIIVTLINGAIVLALFIFMHKKYGLSG